MKKLILAALCTTIALWAETPGLIAIKNARIVTVSGAEIASGTVVIRDGLIEDVGAGVKEPAGAWVIDGAGLIVYPGLIDAMSTWGIASLATAPTSGGPPTGGGRRTLPDFPPTGTPSQEPQGPPARGPEDRPLNYAFDKAADMVSPSDRRLEAARNAGFTGAVTFPDRGIFAGHGAVINLAGQRSGNMVLQPSAGLYLTMRSNGFGGGGGFPGSLMGTIAYIRQIFIDAEYYKAAKDFYAANPVGNKRPDYDRTLEGVLEAQRVLLPAWDRKEIDRMLRFAAELKLKPVLYGGQGAWQAADLLKGKNVPLLVNVRWPERSREADPELQESLRVLESRENSPAAPVALSKAGVKYAFYSRGIERPSDVGRSVKRAIESGLSRADAIRAMTLSVAEIFGVSDRVGSIDKGKIANLVITKGDLFEERTEIKYVFIDGIKYEPAPEAPAAGGEVTR